MKFIVVVYELLHSNKKKMYLSYILFSSFFYLLVSIHSPLSVLVYFGHDDMLFINHAQSLAEGKWLGSFGELTLAKGPGYPFFLAVNYWLGLPITFTQALFHCFSLVVLSLLVLKVSKSFMLAATLFLFTLWDPRVFELDRILRGAIYSSQAILIIALFVFILFKEKEGVKKDIYSIVLGVLFGWFWLTREEGIWLIPGVSFLVLFAIIRKKYHINKNSIFRPILISVVFFIVTQISFSVGNYVAYGEFAGVDAKEKSFQAALKSMRSVRVGNRIPYLSVPRAVRKEIYKISPAFSELEKYIDPPNSIAAFEDLGCSSRPTTCGDIGNGFFMWAVRSAAGKSGYYSSPKTASKFYEEINREIQNACKDGLIKCESNPIPYLPPITLAQLRTIPSVFKSVWDSILSAGTIHRASFEITGSEQSFNRALSVLNFPAHHPRIDEQFNVKIAGWYHRRGNGSDWFSLKVSDDSNENLPFVLLRTESNDLVSAFGDENATNQRFQIKTRCSDGCKLSFVSSLGDNFVVPVQNSQKFMSKSKGNITLAFDYINSGLGNIRVHFSMNVREFLHYFYTKILSLLIITGLISFVAACFLALKNSYYPILLAISGSCWISILARSIILVLVEISSFSAVINPYMQPVFSLSIISSVLSIGLLLDLLRKSDWFGLIH